jgi:ubiquinone/menaquinone biosynthesis C-methylase UbiE
MTTNYDQIATQYQESKHTPWREWIERYSLLNLIGDTTGLSVVDFACGEGYYTRLVKEQGAGRTLGVDLSPGMIELAREQEARTPLGIEYRVADAREPMTDEPFDLAIAAFLLNYAHNRTELSEMCRAVAASIRPGGRFVTVNSNPAIDFSLTPSYRQYGFDVSVPMGTFEGAPIIWTLYVSDGPIQVENYHLPCKAHERALLAAGFREVRWHTPQLTPEHEDRREELATFLEHPPITLIECLK